MVNKMLDQISTFLVAFGALNVGLGVFEIDLISMLLGGWPLAVTVIIGAIGISGLMLLWNTYFR